MSVSSTNNSTEQISPINLINEPVKSLSVTTSPKKDSPENCKTEADNVLDKSERNLSPARNPATNVLHITNLVRPYTLKQLKEQLLRKHGPLIEEKFWTDSFRSRCYVVYESTDDALKARNAIHGLKWPVANTKTLRVDFGKLSEVNELLNLDKLRSKDEKVINNNDKLNDCNNKIEEKVLAYADKPKENPQNQPQLNENFSKPNNNEIKQKLNNQRLSPPKHSVTNIIYVRNLSRPFTLNQLKELLSQIGPLNEEKFWIDKIKSKCYAYYENEETAIKTREILHNLTWPTGNQRKLVCDFASETELENLLNQNRLDKASKEIHEQVQFKDEIRNNRPHDNNRPNGTSLDKNDKNTRNEEEVNHQEKNDHQTESSLSKRRRERSLTPPRNKRDHRGERVDQPHSPKEPRLKENNYHIKESPGKLLDDLFRKTKTVPSIYWMPLNENQIRLRDEKRENRRLEDERRQQENIERMRRQEMNSYHQYNGIRRRTPQPRERTPPFRRGYEPDSRDRMVDRRPPPYRSSERLPPSRHLDNLNYHRNRYLNDRPPIMRRTPPNRTPSNRYHHQERVRRRTPVDNERRNSKSRSVSTHSSSSGSASSRSSASSSGSYKRRISRSRSRSRDKRLTKRPISPMPRHSRSPKSPRRINDARDDRRLSARR